MLQGREDTINDATYRFLKEFLQCIIVDLGTASLTKK
jgi:hypothetical protein